MPISSLAKGRQNYHSDKAFVCDDGHTLPSIDCLFETYGTLNATKSNAILIVHALSTSSHVCSSKDDETPGWWEKMVGPGLAIDTDKYFVVCINNLGSCFGSTGPTSINPETNQAYQADFPVITLKDIARSQYEVQCALGIHSWYALVSPSLGAMIGLQYVIDYPEAVQRFISISSAYKSYASNIAVRSIAREIITLDPTFNDGFYQESSLPGFTLARMLGHLVYRNPESFDSRFDGYQVEKTQGNVIDYLRYNAQKFTSSFDANSFIRLTHAMDYFNVSAGYDSLAAAFARIKASVQVISVSSDTLFFPCHQHEMAKLLEDAGVSVRMDDFNSSYGHDAFLVEIEGMGALIRDFLA